MQKVMTSRCYSFLEIYKKEDKKGMKKGILQKNGKGAEEPKERGQKQVENVNIFQLSTDN